MNTRNDTYSVDENDVQHSQKVDMPPAKDALESRQTQLRAWRTTNIIHALDRKLDLLLAEVKGPRIFRQIGNQPEASESDSQADHAVHDEQPLPTRKAVQTIHTLVHACLKVSAEHPRGCGRGVEDASSLGEFRRLVPRSQNHVRGRVEDGLEQADEEADGDDVVRRGDGGQTEC